MTVTSCSISFGSNALALKDDVASVTVVAGGTQSIVDVTDFETGLRDAKPYATFEPDFWILDGNYKFAPATGAHVGYMSTVQSAADTDFSPTVPLVKFIFGAVYSTDGLTLHFSGYSGDWADSIQIRFYDSVDAQIRSDNYTPSSAEFSTGQAVANFKRIDIYLLSTNKAYRFARLVGVDFDTLTTFTGAEITEARLVEQINLLSTELPFNTLDFSLYSSVGAFSIVAPTGVYAALEENEPLDAYETINNEMIYLGRFYLDTWESESANLANFHAIDAIGLMGKTPLDMVTPGNMLGGISVGSFLGYVGFSYELDAGFTDSVTLYLWTPGGTVRDAFQRQLFGARAYASCARSKVIKVYAFELASDLVAYDYTLTGADKGIESPVELKPLVTGVEITSNHYIIDATYVETIVYQAAYAAGTHYIQHDEPAYAFTSITGGSHVTTTPSYTEFTVAAPGTVTITYTVYAKNKSTDPTGVYADPLPTIVNVLKITDARFVYVEQEATPAQNVYDYYLQRYIQKTTLFASKIAVGNSVLIDTQSSRQIKGIVEKMETDLAGGFVSKVEIVGVVVAV